MPIDLLLLEEGRHFPAASDVTSKIVVNKRATIKVDQRPTKARTEKKMTDDLRQPEQCSGEVESSKGSSTQCSVNDNQDSQLVVTTPTLVQQLNKWRYLSDDKQE